MAKKTWKEKFESGKPPVNKRIDKTFGDMPEGSMMRISSPQEIQETLYTLPKGKRITSKELRQLLAKPNGADHTCPMTTSIFLRVVAELAWEEHLAGKPLEELPPFWRAIEPDTPLAKKLVCGVDALIKMRTEESKDAR